MVDPEQANSRRPDPSAKTPKLTTVSCVVTCRFSARLLKGNGARLHPAWRRTFIQVEPKPLRETQTVRSTSAKNTDFRLVGSGEQLQPARSKKNPSRNPNPGGSVPPESGDCVNISGRTNVTKWTSCCWVDSLAAAFYFLTKKKYH